MSAKLQGGALRRRPLGRTQQSFLRLLVEHRSWHDGAGWYWGTHGQTVKLLEGLIPRGLVEKVEETYDLTRTRTRTRYVATRRAFAHFHIMHPDDVAARPKPPEPTAEEKRARIQAHYLDRVAKLHRLHIAPHFNPDGGMSPAQRENLAAYSSKTELARIERDEQLAMVRDPENFAEVAAGHGGAS